MAKVQVDGFCSPTRRAIVQGIGGSLVGGLAPGAAWSEETRAAGLAGLARRAGVVFGVAADKEILADAEYRALVLANCDLLTPPVSLKIAALQPREGDFQFGDGDALIDFAEAHHLAARGHTLIWNDYPPDWLLTKSLSELARQFDAYIDRVVPHYAGRLQSWDVVNEPFWLGRDRPGTLRPGPWTTAFGEPYIARAFRRTAALDPRARLVLNEAWSECADPVGLAVRASLLRLIDDLQHQGVKLDAIGLQGHILPNEPWEEEGFVAFLHAIAERKLDIYLTELDVEDKSLTGAVAERDLKTGELTYRLLKAALGVPAVKMVVAFSLTDKYSWFRNPWFTRRQHPPHLARPCPFDDAMRPKPMADAIARAMRERAA